MQQRVSEPYHSSLLARLGVAALAVLAVCACSLASLGYANVPLLLAYRADQWFALDGEQAMLVKTGLTEVHAWHRQSQLPRLLEAAQDVRSRLDRPLTAADADWLVGEAQQQYRATVERMIDQAGPVIASLRPEQIAHVEERFAKRNREFAEKYIDAAAEKVRDARFERVREAAEDWLGPLSAEQRQWLRDRIETIAMDYRATLADSQRRQRELVSLLKRAAVGPAGAALGATPSSPLAALKGWATDWEAGRASEYRAQTRAWMQGYKLLWLDLINAAAPNQKAHLKQRLEHYVAALAPFVEASRKNAAPGAGAAPELRSGRENRS